MSKQRNLPWAWIPTLYLYQGIPYSMVMTTSGLIYKTMGVSVSDLAFWTSLLYLPWAVKPLWSPYVEMVSTKRNWVLVTQLLMGLAFALAGAMMPLVYFFPLSLAVFALIALLSASHDIAADGFYMLALNKHQQSYFIGIRNTFFRIAMLLSVGGVSMLTGLWQGKVSVGWTLSLAILGGFLILIGLLHRGLLPHPAEKKEKERMSIRAYGTVFRGFFTKTGVWPALLFFLLYRFGEAQAMKIVTPFLVEARELGGMGLTPSQYGMAYGTVGMVAIMLGGILGGFSAARFGLKRLMWVMALSMNLPNLGMFYMAVFQPLPQDALVYAAIVLEQFGYGFGFTAYMIYLLHYVGDSQYKTAEYAIGTSIMALGMLLPGMLSGYMAEWLGYPGFFIYVLICTLPGMAVIPFLVIDPAFGKRKRESDA